MTVVRNGNAETTQVPVGSHPTLLFMPIFSPPAYLDGRSYLRGIDLCGMITVQVGGPSLDEVVKLTRADQIQVSSKFRPVAFARLIARIAYATAVAKFGVERMGNAYVLPAVLGKAEDVGRWVGCLEGGDSPAGKDLHNVDLRTDGQVIMANVRLFSALRTPVYSVVVGQIRPPQ